MEGVVTFRRSISGERYSLIKKRGKKKVQFPPRRERKKGKKNY